MAADLSGFEGYVNKVLPFKTVDGLELKVDVLYPSTKPTSPPPVLIHYHGGFLVRLCLSQITGKERPYRLNSSSCS